MEERITKIKDYMKENKETIAGWGVIIGISWASWFAGRNSLTEEIVTSTTCIDKDTGNTIKEVYRKTVR